jgi:hypothetical protein
MDNSHERFGHLTFQTENAGVRVGLERAILEVRNGGGNELHFVSIFGGDSAMAAVKVAITSKKPVVLTDPEGRNQSCYFDENTEVFQSDFRVPGRKHPLRHLIATSPTVMGRGASTNLVVPHYEKELVWKMLVFRLAIPGVPAWCDFIMDKLLAKGSVLPLFGVNCEPVMVMVDRVQVLRWLSQGLATGDISLPETNGMVVWPSYLLKDAFGSPQTSAAPLTAPLAA